MENSANNRNCEGNVRAAAEENSATTFGQKVNEAVLDHRQFPSSDNRRNNQRIQNGVNRESSGYDQPICEGNVRVAAEENSATVSLDHRQFPSSDNHRNYQSPSSFLNEFKRLYLQNGGESSGYNSGDVNYIPRIYSIILFSMSLEISQELQRKINGGLSDMIFDFVIQQFFNLMVDPYGHQVLITLIQKCSYEKITPILRIITQNQLQFVTICDHHHGNRVIQSLMRCLHTEEQVLRIVEAISMVILPLSRNFYAKHVIKECFIQFSSFENKILTQVITKNFHQIVIDQYGSRMLEECLTIDCDDLKHTLIREIIANVFNLCMDQYGNYVIQHVVEMKDQKVNDDLISALKGNYTNLACNKYGNHVVQKLLEVGNINNSRMIIYDMLQDINILLTNPYGNYVIQTAWLVSQDDVRHILMWHIHENFK